MNKLMNLEFMCCVLYGLNEIYSKKLKKRKLDSNMSIFNYTGLTSNLDEEKIKDLFSKNPKCYKFTYKKLFNEEDVGLELDANIVKKRQQEEQSIKILLNKNNLPIEQSEIYHKTTTEYYDYNTNYDISKFEDTNYDENQMNEELHGKNNKTLMESFVTNDESSKFSKKTVSCYDAIIEEYCPEIFQELRSNECINIEDLMTSLNPEENKDSMLKIRESSGKSGSFFFFSNDKRFIIKTVKEEELNTMLGEFMKNYYIHIINNPESFLARIYGLYTIKIK